MPPLYRSLFYSEKGVPRKEKEVVTKSSPPSGGAQIKRLHPGTTQNPRARNSHDTEVVAKAY